MIFKFGGNVPLVMHAPNMQISQITKYGWKIVSYLIHQNSTAAASLRLFLLFAGLIDRLRGFMRQYQFSWNHKICFHNYYYSFRLRRNEIK